MVQVRNFLRTLLLFIVIFSAKSASAADLLGGGLADVVQLNSDTYSTNLKTQRTELEGNVHLKLGDRELFADKLTIDLTSGEVEVVGKVSFKQGELEIEARGVKFNMKTGLGIFYNSSLKRAGAFTLEGKEIKRESEKVFVAKVAKISFCQDCPQSWSLVGDRLRVNTERYAEIHHAVVEIKDVPVFYLPVLYYPAQDKRFSGFLIPYFKFSKALGAQIGIPFYYAANDALDFTYDYRYMSVGGHRNDIESRLNLSEYSYWKSNTSWIRTPHNSEWERDRYGLHYSGRFQLGENWSFLTRGDHVSDVEMSQDFEDDSLESRLPTLSNDFFLASQYENFSLYGGVRLPEDNIDRGPGTRRGASWVMPEVKLGTPLTPLIDNTFLGSVRMEELSVRRLQNSDIGNQFGRDPDSGFISSGDRYTGLMDVSLPLSLDYVRSTSHAQYRGDYYQFPSTISPQTAVRSHFLFQEALEGDVWKVFQMSGDSNMPRMKHVLTPFVEYSYSPPDIHSHSEFFSDYPNGPLTSAPRFDLNDGGTLGEPISLGTEESEKRLRAHHLIDYGFKSRLLGKFVDKDEIREILYLRLGHEYDLLNNQQGKILLTAQGYYSDFTLSSQISWDYKKSEFDLQNDILWDKKLFSINFYQTIRPDTENIGGELRLKKVGPFELATEQNYDQRERQLLEQKYYISYASFSKCWRIDFGLRKRQGYNDFEYSPSVQVMYSEVLKDRDAILKPPASDAGAGTGT